MNFLSSKKNVLFLLILSTLGACVHSEVRSSGAKLPQAETMFDDGELKVTAEHNCSGGRCDSVTLNFENLTPDNLQFLPAQSKIHRAGETYPLVKAESEDKKAADAAPVLLPPKTKKSVTLSPYSPVSKKKMSYTKVTDVWCSLKVDTRCKDISRGETFCAGFARYYHQAYVSAGGWIGFSLAYKTPWKTNTLKTLAPQNVTEPPPVVPVVNGDGPSWLSSSDERLIHKVECDDKCVCKELTPRRNFFQDDKFLPVP